MCTACKKSINGMKKRKNSRRRRVASVGKLETKGMMKTATDLVLPIAAGGLAANYTDKLPFLGENPKYVAPANILIGLFGAGSTSGFLQKAFLGVAVNGAVTLVNQELVNGIGDGLPYKVSSNYTRNGSGLQISQG